MQPEDMITAGEAIDAFREAKLSETTFRRRVKSGKITKTLPEGRERGALYPREQVIAAISEITKKRLKKIKNGPQRKRTVQHSDLKPTKFVKAIGQDMPEIAALLETFYTAKINIERRKAWIERNPDIAYILQSQGKVVGCAFIMPLSEEKILTTLSREAKPPTQPGEIFLYEPGKTVYLYVRSTGVLQQGVSKKQRRYWAASLINGLAKVIIELGARGIIIEKIYAQVDTRSGEHALKILGFTQIQIISETNWSNFVLNVPASGAKLSIRYKKALNAWRAQYEQE